MSIFDRYLRWRHTRGYGVHSPYAYRFITDVLRPGDYGYYAYNQLEALNRNLKSSRSTFFREARFLIRLSVFLDTKRIITYQEKYPEAQIVAKALKKVYYCCERADSISFKEGDLLIILPGAKTGEEIILKAIVNNVPVFAIQPTCKIRELIEKPISHGVLFYGKNKILLIPRAHMEYVAYSINL